MQSPSPSQPQSEQQVELSSLPSHNPSPQVVLSHAPNPAIPPSSTQCANSGGQSQIVHADTRVQ